MIYFEVIQSFDKILNYKKQWDQLFDYGEHEASTSLEWTQALLATHLKEDTFLLIVLKNAEEIIGIVPLVISRQRRYGVSLTSLFPISEYYNTHSDLLLNNLSEELIRVFVTALFSLEFNWDVFRIGSFIETNPILGHIKNHLMKTSIKYKIKREEPSFYIPLNGTYDEYLKKRSDKFRNYLRRIEKKIRTAGDVKFRKLQDFGTIIDAYNQLLYIEEKSWKHKHGTAITSIKKQEDFYRRLCRNASKKGWLHLFFLYLNDDPIAYNLGLIKNGKYLYLKTSFNEEFRAVSPSTVLRAKLIYELTHEGMREFDFPGEPYEWESQWTKDIRWHKSVLVFNSTLKAKLFSIYNTHKHKVKRHDRKSRFKYHNPQNIESTK